MNDFKPFIQGAPQPISAQAPATSAEPHLVTAPPSLIPVRQSPLLRHACSSACVSKGWGGPCLEGLPLSSSPVHIHFLQYPTPTTPPLEHLSYDEGGGSRPVFSLPPNPATYNPTAPSQS